MFYAHVHCTTKMLEPTLKEMKGNSDDKLLLPVLAPLANEFQNCLY